MTLDSYTDGLRRENLRVVVLGPGEAEPCEYRKRCQIAHRLRRHGYELTQLGEELLGEPSAPLAIALEHLIDHFDLLLVLNAGVAPLVELTSISKNYAARAKTRVWMKREYRGRQKSAPDDVVKMFEHWLYSETEFDTSELITSIIDATDRFCMNRAQREGRLTMFGLNPPGWS